MPQPDHVVDIEQMDGSLYTGDMKGGAADGRGSLSCYEFLMRCVVLRQRIMLRISYAMSCTEIPTMVLWAMRCAVLTMLRPGVKMWPNGKQHEGSLAPLPNCYPICYAMPGTNKPYGATSIFLSTRYAMPLSLIHISEPTRPRLI
eukprot:1003299-Rhodomonas_salina.1